ncbi:MAG TPA: hypothetical protein VIJ88_02075 [Candidatus Paceibacterota bacterium]
MSLSRSLIASATALVFALALVPAFAFAQSYNCTGNTNSGWSFWNNNNNNTTVCTPGHLLVYVQVNNNINNGYNRAPSDFTVAVSGLNASPSSFPGSLSGTEVSVSGTYSVVALQLQGYSASYSAGCNGTINNSQSGLCVVTESNSSSYYNQYPTPYPYPYTNIPLTCTPSYQTVNLGQTITFTAQGGDYSQYNWQTPNRSYLNIGPTLNVALLSTGTQTVTVSNGQGIATCTVNVVINGAPAPIVINPANPIYPANYNYNVSVTPTYIPSLPNTGFEPMSATEAASAAALLIAVALIALPYVRQAFIAVLS